MSHSENTKSLLLVHCKEYPCLQLQDIFKFIHQSAFGCEHLVTDTAAAIRYIEEEAEAAVFCSENTVEMLDGDFCRVNLNWLKSGISTQTLGKLFALSAQRTTDAVQKCERKLAVLQELSESDLLPFTVNEVKNGIEKWRQNGFCACRHSDEFRKAYHPAYRVIKKDYALFLPLLAHIDRKLKNGNAILAIEGGSASGKTSLSALLKQLYGCTVFHMDDFFLRPEQRTAERFAEVGGNVDRERFLKEVLIPLSENKTVFYRRFDCGTFTLQKPVEMHPTRLTVIEGAYSCHPDLIKFYDLTVFLDIDPALQKQRILRRNGEGLAQRFFNEWIPMEKKYFDATDIKHRCDLHIKIEIE